MSITAFREKFKDTKPGADIVQRWHERVVANGWDKLGRAGASNYLGQFGRGLSTKKAVALARVAEIHACPELAARFFEEAYFLETGTRESLQGEQLVTAPLSAAIDLATPFGQPPQLLTVLDEADAMRLVDDPAWGVQEKIDGERLLVRKEASAIGGGNKRGLVRHLPAEIASSILPLADLMVDGELVSHPAFGYHVFDLLKEGGTDFSNHPFIVRHAMLAQIHASMPESAQAIVKLVPLHVSLEDKRRAVVELRERGAEGFVLKRLSAPYTSGEAHGDQFKFQFRSSSAFIVGDATEGKRSVQLLALRDDGTKRDFGRVTIPVNQSIPASGSVVEIEYLYCHGGEDGKLAQPVFKGSRSDAPEEDCQVRKVRVRAQT